MDNKYVWIIPVVCSIALSGCGMRSTTDSANPNTKSLIYSRVDNRLFDNKVTSKDLLLRKGDANIVPKMRAGRAESSASTGGHHLKMLNGTNGLIEVWPNPAITPNQGGYTENVISTAVMYYGTPYEYGSDRSDPSTFDCSDFTRWAYLASLGMDLPKDSRNQALYVQTYSNRTYTNIYEAQRGDLLFFVSFNGIKPERYFKMNKSIDNITHTGIYLGNGKIIHTASAATGGVRIDNVFGNHLEWRLVLGGSVLDIK